MIPSRPRAVSRAMTSGGYSPAGGVG
jgi:hypothetical protein